MKVEARGIIFIAEFDEEANLFRATSEALPWMRVSAEDLIILQRALENILDNFEPFVNSLEAAVEERKAKPKLHLVN